MESRTFEGPMDWEYQDGGPLDPTSPFAHAAHNASRSNMFGSPFKAPRPHNPFASLSTPSKLQPRPHSAFASLSTPTKPQPQPQPPQSSTFTPQLAPRSTAPPFRNPAFTTPRRPVDEVVLSEASGAEDSPASEYPNDTPEVDHRSDATLSPRKIDKASRYGRAGPVAFRKHASGKGEIRPHRELSVGMRKRKRHNYDRDVGSVGRQAHDSDGWDSDSDSSATRKAATDGGDAAQQPRPGALEALFHALNKYPNTPEHMQRWMQFGANLFLVSVLAYIGWSVVSTVRNDIHRANASARTEFEKGVADCRRQYTINKCIDNTRPGLMALCSEWHECMMQDAESIIRVKVTVKQVAEILNEFTDAMNLKAWGMVLGLILVCTTVNVGSLTRPSAQARKGEAPPPSQGHEATLAAARSPGGMAPGYMLVPVHTPKLRRRAMLEEGTDTDNSPLGLKPALAYQTPSGRRSPSKGERERERQLSPVKYGLAPGRGA